MKTVNDFYCGLRFLVALGDQAEASLKIWENLLFDDVSKVRSLTHGGYSKGDSGTLRLIKSVCKSVSERGCEKSGRMVSFATFLKENFNAKDIPLYPFLGNRFNIIFLNGAGVFELFSKIMSFFDLIDKENKLLTAVYYDFNVLQYKIGSRALRLIHKLVTGPLWRKFESEKSVLDMSGHYQSMLVLFEKWASDCTLFVKG